MQWKSNQIVGYLKPSKRKDDSCIQKYQRSVPKILYIVMGLHTHGQACYNTVTMNDICEGYVVGWNSITSVIYSLNINLLQAVTC